MLQADLLAKTWRMGHFVTGTEGIVVAAVGVFPGSPAAPWTLRLEGDADGTERFLLNGTLVQSVDDAGAPTPTGATHVGFGEFWQSNFSPSPQIRSLTASGTRYTTSAPPAPPTSPRIERFRAQPLSGTDWAVPDHVAAITDPTKARGNARKIEEDFWTVGGDPDPGSPLGGTLVDYDGTGQGLFIYSDGWTYDGLGWRDPIGRSAYHDGGIIQPSMALYPQNNPPPGGKPPWAWTPPVDPITGEPSILTVHFCFYDQWL